MAPGGASNSEINQFEALLHRFSFFCARQNAQNTRKGKRTNSLTNRRGREALRRQNDEGKNIGTQPSLIFDFERKREDRKRDQKTFLGFKASGKFGSSTPLREGFID